MIVNVSVGVRLSVSEMNTHLVVVGEEYRRGVQVRWGALAWGGWGEVRVRGRVGEWGGGEGRDEKRGEERTGVLGLGHRRSKSGIALATRHSRIS